MKARNQVAAALALIVTVGFMVVLACLAMHAIPAENKDFFNTALIALISLCSTAFGYYLGSSIGSARKTEIIGETVAPTAPTADQMEVL